MGAAQPPPTAAWEACLVNLPQLSPSRLPLAPSISGGASAEAAAKAAAEVIGRGAVQAKVSSVVSNGGLDGWVDPLHGGAVAASLHHVIQRRFEPPIKTPACPPCPLPAPQAVAAAAAKAFLLPDTDKEACKRVWILTLTDAICLYPGGCPGWTPGARAVPAC